MRILIIAPGNTRIQFLGALINAYHVNNIETTFLDYKENVPGENEIKQAVNDVDAVLYIFPGNRAPGTIIRNLFLFSEDGKKVPVGLVPNKKNLKKFIDTASKVQLRAKDRVTLSILSQRHPRYIRVANRIETILATKSPDILFFKWTSDIVIREDMIKGLNSGLGVAIYLGHGRPVGWVGYYGLRPHHFKDPEKPLGNLISLCCHTANRRRIGLSFAEQIVMNGTAASCMGAVSGTLFTNNTRWAVQIVDRLTENVKNVGELLTKACPINPDSYNSYRLIGDPLAPLQATSTGIYIARSIKTYP